MPRVVLAFSGGAESAAAIPWLIAGGATVVAVLVDLGQRQDLAAAREQALALGAERALVLDRRDEFVHDYAFKALAAGALAASRSPLSVPLSRAVIAQAIVDVAREEAAAAVAYTRGPAKRPHLLGVLLSDLAPDLQVIMVDVRDGRWDRRAGPDVSPAGVGPGHQHRAHEEANLWGRVWWDDEEGDAARHQPPNGGTAPRRLIADPATVAITFERGTPTAVNGVAMPPLDLLASLATLAAAQGVGRIASIDPAGQPPAVEEAPAALVLAAAYEAVAVAAAVPRRDAGDVSAEYAKIIREGRWFSSSRAALESQMDAGSLFATGTATVQLHHGEITQHFS
jgi:argininosuccinate synthase